MAYLPVSGLTPVYSPYPNYWLKFYQAGTTTPLSMATDSGAQTTLAKAQINTQGLPITAGNVVFIPHVNVTYDAFLFPTESEADSNTTVNAIRIADGVAPLELTVSPNTVSTLSDNYTLLNTDNNVIYRCLNVNPISVTVPVNLPAGNVTYFVQENEQTINFIAGTGLTLKTPLGLNPYTQNSIVCIISLDSTTALLTGDLG